MCWMGKEHEQRGFCWEQKGEDVLWAGWRALHPAGSVLLSILVISELLRNLGQLCETKSADLEQKGMPCTCQNRCFGISHA